MAGTLLLVVSSSFYLMSASEPATVLVVDDERDVADAYAAQLEGDYIVSTAYSGREALDTLDASIDVVLLDRRMPGISGDEVLEHIRDRRLNCRVAMVTAVDPDFDIIEMPFDDYVIKPVSRDDLFDTIERLLTCSDYASQLQEYYSLTAKHAALAANKPEAELAENDQFQGLEDRLDDLRENLDRTVASFDDDDFAAAFRDLGGQAAGPVEK
jgi:DNA-binding response OmpR family regulator